MKIQIKKIKKDAKIPRFALEGDAAMDLFSNEELVIRPGERVSCKTGVAIKLPAGYAGLIWDKGSLSHKFGLKMLGGVFDSNYLGEWFIGLINLSDKEYRIEKGQKIAQVVFQKIEVPEIEEVSEFEATTTRGEKGFGSTGKF
jgi:dUTP pyrophosphatase